MTLDPVRYCPMCNRATPVERTTYPPMVVDTCRECGHVHRVGPEREGGPMP